MRGGSSLPFGGCGAGPCPVFLHAGPAFLPSSRRAAVRTRLDRRPRPRPRLPVLGGAGAAPALCGGFTGAGLLLRAALRLLFSKNAF